MCCSRNEPSVIAIFFLWLISLSPLFAIPVYQMTVCVSSKQLQYSNAEAFFDSLLKQGSAPTIGHAWIRLSLLEEGIPIQTIEGGHSGEFGVLAPQYFTMLLMEAKKEEVTDPVRVLFQPMHDGVFERGDGGHIPTYALTIDIEEEAYLSLLSLMDVKKSEYPFSTWSMTEHNCVRFVLTCLGRIGIVLDATNVIQIPPVTFIGGQPVRMWSDARYATIEVPTPEKLESELKKLAASGIGVESVRQ